VKAELKIQRSLVGAFLVGLCVDAGADAPVTWKEICQEVGHSAPEPLGDREGHEFWTGEYTCRADGGPLDGSVDTGANMYEYDKANAVLLSGFGVNRKPGAIAAYQQTEGKLALTIADGKVTGASGSGAGRFTMATGAAAALSGKRYTFKWATTGPFQYTVDIRAE
jgi:hypothetical protein